MKNEWKGNGTRNVIQNLCPYILSGVKNITQLCPVNSRETEKIQADTLNYVHLGRRPL
jgi:hypothetical protein